MDRLVLLAAITCLCLSMAAWETMAGELDRTVRQWSTAEWSLAGSAAKGNPFDVEAAAEFTCAATGEKRTTGLFYAGKAAAAVDCILPYREIDLAPLRAGAATIKLPRKSDWAIAIGAFPAGQAP